MVLRYVVLLAALAALGLGHAILIGLWRRTTAAKWKPRLALISLVVCVSFITLELVFMHVANPNTGGHALSEALWFQRHWNPINSLGYRDVEPDQAEIHDNAPNVLFLGDSFTAGHGVRFHETVSSRFRDKCGQEDILANVFNCGANGADTRFELKMLTQFPRAADVLVFQYFGNDIDGAANDVGIPRYRVAFYTDLPALIRPLVKKSYLLNFVYWRFPHTEWVEEFYKYYRTAYSNPDAVRIHLDDVQRVIDTARDRGIHVVMLIYPNLQNAELSDTYVGLIRAFCEEQSVPYIDVTEVADALPVEDRVVGANDGHPSVELNRLTSAALFDSGLAFPPEQTVRMTRESSSVDSTANGEERPQEDATTTDAQVRS